MVLHWSHLALILLSSIWPDSQKDIFLFLIFPVGHASINYVLWWIAHPNLVRFLVHLLCSSDPYLIDTLVLAILKQTILRHVYNINMTVHHPFSRIESRNDRHHINTQPLPSSIAVIILAEKLIERGEGGENCSERWGGGNYSIIDCIDPCFWIIQGSCFLNNAIDSIELLNQRPDSDRSLISWF